MTHQPAPPPNPPARPGPYAWIQAFPEPALVLSALAEVDGANEAGLAWFLTVQVAGGVEWPTLLAAAALAGASGLDWMSPPGSDLGPAGDMIRIRPLPGDDGAFLVTVQSVPIIQNQADTPFFSLSPLPMWVFDGETLKFLAVNEAAIARYGYSRDEFLSFTLLKILPSEEYSGTTQGLAKVQGGLGNLCRWRHLTQNGELLPVQVFSHHISFGDHSAVLAMILDEPETPRQPDEVTRHERRFRSLVEKGSDVVIVVDAAGNRIYVSPNYARISGRDPVTSIGTSIFTVIHPEDHVKVRKGFNALRAHPGLARSVTLRSLVSGAYRWLNVVATNRLDDPDVAGIVLNCSDITEQKLADDALRETEQRLDLALSGAGIGCWDWDIPGKHATVDERFARQLGYTVLEYEALEPHNNAVHPEDQEKVATMTEAIIASPTGEIDTTFRAISRDGRVIWVRNIGRVTERDRLGDPIRAVGIRLDVTEKELKDQALAESERRHRLLAEHATDVILRLSTAGVISYASRAFEEVTGKAPRAAVGQDLLSYVDPADREGVSIAMRSLTPGQALGSLLFRVIGPKGPVWMEGAARGITGDLGETEVVLIARDTEDRLRSEGAIRLSEQRWRRMMENLPAGVALIQDGRLLFNQIIEKITGYLPSEISTVDEWLQRVFDEPDRARASYLAAKAEGFPRILKEWIRHKDGRYRFVEMAGFEDDAGEVWVLHEITRQRQAEDRLRRQNDELNAVSNIQEVLLGTESSSAVHEAILRQAAVLTGASHLWLAEVVTDDSGRVRTLQDHQSQWSSRGAGPYFQFGVLVNEFPTVLLEPIHPGSWKVVGDDESITWNFLSRGGELVGVLGRMYSVGAVPPLASTLEALWRTVAQTLETMQNYRSRRQLEQSAQAQAQILAQVQEAVISIDLSGHISSWNNGARCMFGFSEQEAMGLPLSILFPISPRSSVEHQATLALTRSASYTVETAMVTQSFEVFYARAQFTHLRAEDGSVIGRILYVFDVTERRKAEMRVRQMNQKLEERVRRRTHQLEGAIRELEAFTYTVSHDLRSPLRAISGYANLLIEEHNTEMSAESAELLSSIDRNAIRMGRLIDDLLRLSRLGRQALDKRQVNLNELLDEVIAQLAHELKDRDVKFLRDPLPTVMADSALLSMVYTNLVGNALKFTQKCATARVELRYMPDADGVTLGVVDNGDGFDMRYAGKLFNVFQRLHSEQEFAGTGVGLAIVKRIVERHGGRVWANSKPGEGAAFWFTIPHNGPDIQASPDVL